MNGVWRFSFVCEILRAADLTGVVLLVEKCESSFCRFECVWPLW